MDLRGLFKEESSVSAAERVLARIPEVGVAPLVNALRRSADADRAVANIDRWLAAGGGSPVRSEALARDPALRYRLVTLVAASQAIGDMFVQNPEMALMLADSDEMSKPVEASEIIEEGRRILSDAGSFSHALDRLRFLKQKKVVGIVWHDLNASWQPEQVWRALSELADGILRLTAELVWSEIGSGELPVAVIALGKHGSRELNYSSDIDLQFVARDDIDDLDTCAQFCERFMRAVSGRMGRGALYRVDTRLRPMGSAGPVIQRLSAALAYYRNYADPWEIQMLIRARTCAGSDEVGTRFTEAVSSEVYKGARSDLFLDGLVEAKRRYEREIQSRQETERNVKLGRGGIRDVEFIVQLLQLLSGKRYPEVRGLGTLPATAALEKVGILTEREAGVLSSGYRLLRQVEHRIQLLHDLQSHMLPADPRGQQVLAALVGASSWKRLRAEIRRIRFLIRSILEARIPKLAVPSEESTRVIDSLGMNPDSSEAATVRKLLTMMEDSGEVAKEIEASGRMRERVDLIASRAPRVVSEIAFHSELWDVAFSEEVEHEGADEVDPGTALAERLASIGEDWESEFAGELRRLWTAACLKFAWHGDLERASAYLDKISSRALLLALDRLGGQDIDVIALGRLGSRDLLLPSDWDVAFVVRDPAQTQRAERIGEELLKLTRRLAVSSAYFPLDTRLRPEGSAGLVVRSLAAVETYGWQAMEPWERLAYTRARSLRGWQETDSTLRSVVYGALWSEEAEQQIDHLRARVHRERARPNELHRNLKLGPGFSMDVEWLVGASKLHLSLSDVPTRTTCVELRALAERQVINVYERDELSAAYQLYGSLRNALWLLEMDSDAVLPENPDRLAKLAHFLSYDGPNQLLSAVERYKSTVIEVYDRLKRGRAAC